MTFLQMVCPVIETLGKRLVGSTGKDGSAVSGRGY